VDSVVRHLKCFDPLDNDLYIDGKAFGEMGGKYIFSRFELDNENEIEMELIGVYGTDRNPYAVYVYALGT
ncbi:MAG: hypothetical protein K2P19_13225, partial [Kineothrix sp.]|nr:hypothetical protein [Kineothrix sp.]